MRDEHQLLFSTIPFHTVDTAFSSPLNLKALFPEACLLHSVLFCVFQPVTPYDCFDHTSDNLPGSNVQGPQEGNICAMYPTFVTSRRTHSLLEFIYDNSSTLLSWVTLRFLPGSRFEGHSHCDPCTSQFAIVPPAARRGVCCYIRNRRYLTAGLNT